jgi:hypothetical protein
MATSSISSTSGSTSTQVSTDVYNRVEQAMASQSKAAAKTQYVDYQGPDQAVGAWGS